MSLRLPDLLHLASYRIFWSYYLGSLLEMLSGKQVTGKAPVCVRVEFRVLSNLGLATVHGPASASRTALLQLDCLLVVASHVIDTPARTLVAK